MPKNESVVNTGLICADCGTPFVEAHGRPVLCPNCKQANNPTGQFAHLPRAWFEEKIRSESRPPQRTERLS